MTDQPHSCAKRAPSRAARQRTEEIRRHQVWCKFSKESSAASRGGADVQTLKREAGTSITYNTRLTVKNFTLTRKRACKSAYNVLLSLMHVYNLRHVMLCNHNSLSGRLRRFRSSSSRGLSSLETGSNRKQRRQPSTCEEGNCLHAPATCCHLMFSVTWFFLRARSSGVSFFLSLAFTFAFACPTSIMANRMQSETMKILQARTWSALRNQDRMP